MSETPETDELFYAILKKIKSKEDLALIWPLVRLSRKLEKAVKLNSKEHK